MTYVLAPAFQEILNITEPMGSRRDYTVSKIVALGSVVVEMFWMFGGMLDINPARTMV